eukprot:CAMPEP_0174368634 /NCGR_PEP_ID=MMETSP0811_2-20130205/89825_1 /TAXON_ID=73025 ORGANISM="Eutreptiella gymnastica-like, Strain CCMP1594" /NCGR_SAMPLE_ID=MMETSP0811_2 /ASSEMBLY_ACC=CAM_ASM_000667 /LENGTH=90 /DNA_ID=CAMNT_0015512341 /DNA_START=213 /DNA_END=481 /DNA_ORIENTATION=+
MDPDQGTCKTEKVGNEGLYDAAPEVPLCIRVSEEWYGTILVTFRRGSAEQWCVQRQSSSVKHPKRQNVDSDNALRTGACFGLNVTLPAST